MQLSLDVCKCLPPFCRGKFLTPIHSFTSASICLLFSYVNWEITLRTPYVHRPIFKYTRSLYISPSSSKPNNPVGSFQLCAKMVKLVISSTLLTTSRIFPNSTLVYKWTSAAGSINGATYTRSIGPRCVHQWRIFHNHTFCSLTENFSSGCAGLSAVPVQHIFPG